MKEEIRKVAKAGWPLEAGWVVFGEVSKLGGHSDEYPVKPSQHIKDILLTGPAGIMGGFGVILVT